MINVKFRIVSLGCKANQYDSAYMARLLTAAGYVSSKDEADICIVNSCTVTAMADSKSGKMLRRMRREYPNALLILTGCMAQVKEDVAEKYPEADIIIGITEQRDIVRVIEDYKESGKFCRVEENNGEVSSFIETFPEHSRAFLKVEDGCDNFCAYCIVPFARGRVRSKPMDTVLEEIECLTDGGYNELVLTGINMSEYGKDTGETFLSLLQMIEKQGKAKRVRVSSVDPILLSDDFIEKISEIKCLCPHFHLSLQSGCDETLKRMGRKHTAEYVTEQVEKLRKAVPHIQFTCDVIVGFPGETDEEFNKTFDFLKNLNLLDMHVFQYSKRPGTRAAKMADQVPEEIKKIRSEKLIQLGNDMREKIVSEESKRTLSVLFETEKEGEYGGFSREYIPVRRKGKYRSGEIYDVCPE